MNLVVVVVAAPLLVLAFVKGVVLTDVMEQEHFGIVKRKNMKKISLVLLIMCLSFSLFYNKSDKGDLDLNITNIEALAAGEVIIPGACMWNTFSTCMHFGDGYFLTGQRY